MNKKALLSLFVIGTVILAALVTRADETANRIGWLTYEAAKVKSEGQARKYFLFFSSRNCGYCRLLESKTFSNADVSAYINENYIPVRVDVDKDRRVAMRYRIQGVPDLRFLSKDGAEIGRWIGFTEADHLLQLLKYIQTDSYQAMSFDEFVQK